MTIQNKFTEGLQYEYQSADSLLKFSPFKSADLISFVVIVLFFDDSNIQIILK